jgi:hypothetical protein
LMRHFDGRGDEGGAERDLGAQPDRASYGEREDPRAVISGVEMGRARGSDAFAVLGPDGETFGSPAPTKRGEAVEVPGRGSIL